MNDFPVLTLLILTPLLGGSLLLCLGERPAAWARRTALGVAWLTLAEAALITLRFDSGTGAMQFVERHSWIASLAVDYHLGLDGLGLVMVLLSTLLVPMAIVVTPPALGRRPAYLGLMLLLEAGLLGTFTALNFFHWFLFWELSLIPAFFLIRLWGGADRSAAATQFFIYTMVGSVAMLLGFLALYLAVGRFDFEGLAELGSRGGIAAGFRAQFAGNPFAPDTLVMVAFVGILLGFAVKVPLMPFHTWLPTTYAEAPTAVTMLLTGAMSKMGLYGFLRILLPLFPEQIRALQTPLLVVAVATVLLSAAAAFAQRDLKRMLGYSSINHLGYCVLGVIAVAGLSGSESDRAAALNGVVLQMFNHGLTAATLFAMVGWLELRSGGLRGLNDFGGLRRVVPVFCGLMGVAVFSSLGLPGLNGFVGEFLIFKGTFGLAPVSASLAAGGLLLTAIFLLTLSQRVFHGPVNPAWSRFPDLTRTELWVAGPAVAMMLILGLMPQLMLGLTNESVKRWLALLPP